MNNEPIAYVDKVWIDRPDLVASLGVNRMFSRCRLSDQQVPLYTHLEKTLTDEEIMECWNQTVEIEHVAKLYRFQFARAILRKAQEK